MGSPTGDVVECPGVVVIHRGVFLRGVAGLCREVAAVEAANIIRGGPRVRRGGGGADGGGESLCGWRGVYRAGY